MITHRVSWDFILICFVLSTLCRMEVSIRCLLNLHSISVVQSKDECEYLITLAKPHMEKSSVVDGTTGQSKDSRCAFLPHRLEILSSFS